MAFEASVLGQLDFESIAIPFAGSAKLDWYLKLWNKCVLDNDVCQWAWWVAKAKVENNNEQLSPTDVQILLDDSDTQIINPLLLKWFSQQDTIFLENLKRNSKKLKNEHRQSLAIFAGIMVGDYLLSFDHTTAEFHRPVKQVFSDIIPIINRIIDNKQVNFCSNFEAKEFIVRTSCDLMYANLPTPNFMLYFLNSKKFWREVWVRGLDPSQVILHTVKESFGAINTSKDRYLQTLAELLSRSKHIPNWAIGFQEGQPASLEEVTNIIKRFRPIKATYLKDMSQSLEGSKSYIVIAPEKKVKK